MRLLTSALLGTAAVLTASAGVQAADLPSRKAAPAAYVKICDVYGRGFYYIPGTNTCLKVGGRVRFELGWHKAQNTWVQANRGQNVSYAAGTVTTPGIGTVATSVFIGPANGAGGAFFAGSRQDTLGWMARAYVNMDARTQTAWGTVQTVFSIALRSQSGIFNAGGTFVPGANNTASPQVYAAYIRFAGFTFGRAPWLLAAGPGFIFYHTNYSNGSAIGMLQLAYTATFGGGFSATIGLIDANERGRFRSGPNTFTNNVYNSAYSPVVHANLNGIAASVAPNRLPDLALSLRLDQGWGYVQVAGAVGRNTTVVNNSNGVIVPGVFTNRYSKTGYAITAAAKINLPQLAPGDALYFYAGYGNGLIDYVLGGNTMNGSIAKDGRRAGGYNGNHADWNLFACGVTAVGVISAVCSENTKAIAAMVAFTHYWTPSLRSHFAVSFAKTTPGATARSQDWWQYGGQPVTTTWQAATQLVWSPTAGFDIGLELYYARIKNKLACNSPAYAAAGYNIGAGGAACTPWGSVAFSPSTVGVSQNPSDWSVKMRVERTF